VGSAGEGLTEVVARVRARDEHDRQARPVQAHLFEQLEPREIGHDDVAHDEADLLVHEELERLAGGARGDGLVARGLEHVRDQLADDRVVVDDEDPAHWVTTIGRRRTNDAPAPTDESAIRSPPWARAISRLAASLRPEPLAFVVEKGSNMSLRVSGSIPPPVSVTLASAQSPSRSS